MDTKMLKQKMFAENFTANNGRVLRTINILRYEYHKLKLIENVLMDEGIEHWEFMDSINYLSMEGYIKMRNYITEKAVDELSQDVDYKLLEAKLTPKGIKLLAGGIVDEVVEV